MLKKFFKHDGGVLLRALWPIAAAVLGCGVLSSVCIFLEASAFAEKNDVLGFMLGTTQLLSMMASVILTMVGAISVFVIFQQSLFSDEGYLTFLLPVGTHTLLLSKMLIGTVFIVGITAVGLLSILTAVAPMYALNGEMIFSAADWQENMLLLGAHNVLQEILVILALILFVFSGIVTVYSAAVIGGVFGKKYAIAGGLFVGYGLFTAQSLLQVAVMFAIMMPFMSVFAALLIQSLIAAGCAIGEYFFCVYLLKKKLDLV